jgi:hypothetical protein
VKHAFASFALVAAVFATTRAVGQSPLHERIDAAILAKANGTAPADICTDAEFVRRVYLDFSGSIPTAKQTREFLSDKSPGPGKRQRLIDALLAAPTYATRMENLFHVMLMERRGDDENWSAFLIDAFSNNRPWNEIAKEILDPISETEKRRGAAFFITKRLEKYGQNPTDFPGLTRDVGRLFLGLDLQCAECHDHLFIEDYKQIDFKGLFAAYGNTFIRRDVKFPAVGEKEMKAKLEFVSVFDPTQQSTGPRLPGGKEFAIQVSTVDPKKPKPKKAPPRPQFSALKLISESVTKDENKQFALNAVNRCWFVLLGRGIVHPLDLHHSANPASHPELLAMLADEFVKHKFDIKWLLREIALTDAYQRSSQIAGEKIPDAALFLVSAERHLTAEQLLQSVLVATHETRLITIPPKEAPKPASDAPEPKVDLNAAPVYSELKAKFLAAFANAAREPELQVNSTVKGALFWRNAVDVQRLLAKRPGNLTDRLLAVDNDKVVDELFINVLSRMPTAEETRLFEKFLASNKNRQIAISDAAWALLTGAEFFTNH